MRGIIRSIRGNGGIIQIGFEDPETGERQLVMADNAPTVRAFRDIAGDQIIGPGHTVLVEELIGLEFGYDTDDIGLLAYLEA